MWFLWWVRHGAIGPLEATLCGRLSTDLTSELAHFKLEIHLSKAKQLAFPFTSLLRSPADPVVPCDALERSSLRVGCRSEQPETVFFQFRSFWRWTQTCRIRSHSGRSTLSRYGLPFFWWFVGEVEHVVHLIRWNLNSCLCPCGLTWPRSRLGVRHNQ